MHIPKCSTMEMVKHLLTELQKKPCQIKLFTYTFPEERLAAQGIN